MTTDEIMGLAFAYADAAVNFALAGLEYGSLSIAMERADAEVEMARINLEAAVESLRKDAERYRWMRQPTNQMGNGIYTSEELDASIDKAMLDSAK
jgi:hypothetical protein